MLVPIVVCSFIASCILLLNWSGKRRMLKENKKPVPRPSDILIDLIIARILQDPASVKLEIKKRNSISYPLRYASWHDVKSGIDIKYATKATSQFGYGTSESHILHRGKPLAYSKEAEFRFRQALDQIVCWQREAAEAEREYQGDMQACEAIQEMMK